MVDLTLPAKVNILFLLVPQNVLFSVVAALAELTLNNLVLVEILSATPD